MVTRRRKLSIEPATACFTNAGQSQETVSCAPADLKSPEFIKGVIEAFRRTSQGFSIDHLLADDELEAAYSERCRRLGLPGTDTDWNRALIRLRKAGKLSHIRSTRSTEFDWKLSDQFLFASEIAMRQMLDQGVSLDKVLCDRSLKTRFDEIARSFAPGFKSVQYRWGALSIRKWADRKRRKAAGIHDIRMPRSRELSKIKVADLRNSPGIYLISRLPNPEGSALYAGTTLDLGCRLDAIRDGGDLRAGWKVHADTSLFIGYLKLDGRGTNGNSEYDFTSQSQLIGQFDTPPLNYRKLACSKLAG